MATTIRDAAMSLPRIDTHAHLHEPFGNLAEQAKGVGQCRTILEICTSRMLAEGCRAMYGIDPGTYLRPDAPPELFQRADEVYRQGPQAAIAHALDLAKITTQLAFTDTKADVRPVPGLFPRVKYLAYIDPAINGHYEWPCPDRPFESECYYENLCKYFGPLAGLDDFLAALDAAIDAWRSKGVVGLKTAIAYTSGLAISDPTPQQARDAFGRKQAMTEADFRAVHDFAFRHALVACLRNGLPVVIHTGVTVWGRSNLEQTNPMRLHNLLVDNRYKDLTFVLLHGGAPYIGETTWLAGMFTNIIIDFTFVAYMSRPRLRLAVPEWLESVPSSRICWGSDAATPEGIVGVDRITRREVAGILESMIADGMLDEKSAMAALENMYVSTARRVFGL